MWKCEIANVFHVFVIICYSQYDNLIPCPQIYMDQGGGGHSCLMFSGVGVQQGMEVRQWYVSTRLLGLTGTHDGRKVVWMSCLSNHCNSLQIKELKRTFQTIAEMQGPTCTGFGWNNEVKCIIAEKKLFDRLVKVAN